MQDKMNWADRPMWVRIALFGVPSRRAAMLWMKGSLVGTIVLALATFLVATSLFNAAGLAANAVLFSAALALVVTPLMLLGPLWYWLAIQFTDEHDGWTQAA